MRCTNLRVDANGHFTNTDLLVCPASKLVQENFIRAAEGLYLVMLNPSGRDDILGLHPDDQAAGRMLETNGVDDCPVFNQQAAQVRIAALKGDLLRNQEHLQAANEELELSNEQLRASNEEMQSVNEELQSTNEELETSKEEDRKSVV